MEINIKVNSIMDCCMVRGNLSGQMLYNIKGSLPIIE